MADASQGKVNNNNIPTTNQDHSVKNAKHSASTRGPEYRGPKKRSTLQKMLANIIAERKKDKTSEEDQDYILVHGSSDAFWTTVFSKYFLTQNASENDSDSRDDLLFFVRDLTAAQPRYGSSSNLTLTEQDEQVQVFRKDSKNLPSLGDPAYNWEETVYLNLILQQFEYKLTCAVCSRTGDRELQILKKCSQKVYASPSHRSMETKGTGESIAYPNIFFSVDNFEEVFGDIVIRDSEMVCVELVASDRSGDFQAVIFIGSIRYEALKNVFDSRQSTLSAKMRQSFSWGSQTQRLDTRRTEFIRMRGPSGKGYAEMAISRQKGVPDTPGTTPMVTPRTTPMATPLATPLASPRHTPIQTPEKEELPPFPDATNSATNQTNSYNAEDRRFSESNTNSPFKSNFKWSFGIRKSQSATDHVSHMTNDAGEVEAKSISEGAHILSQMCSWDSYAVELHQPPGLGLFGRSFGQAWHWFKEQRRAASVGLNSCLTYVTLPWHRIIGDVLDNTRTPVLSF